MRFRKNLFTVLSVLFVLYIIGGIVLANNATQQTIASGPIGAGSAYALGAAVGGSIVASVVLCTGLPLLITCLFLAWRNGAGLTAERRYKELLGRL